MQINNAIRTAIATAVLAVGGSASAAVITLDFEGLKDAEAINNFYNGGTGSQGSAGTNYGIAFGSDTLALIDRDAGGTGNFAHEPSSSTIMFFLTGTAVLNYAPGFNTGFSFFYTSLTAAGVVRVFDDLNASGNLLTTISLPALGNICVGDPTGAFCNFAIGSGAFVGTAKSVDFGGAFNQIGFDDITFGATRPGDGNGTVPEPGSLALVGAALLGLAAARRRV